MTEREVFEAARTISDVSERNHFLADACAGAPALRARVERLLHVDCERGLLLDSPPLLGFDGGLKADTPNLNAGPTLELHTESAFLPFLTPSDHPDSLGRLGDYELMERLGRGGFGTVFRARDNVLNRDVAIKILYPHLATSEMARRRFLREAQSAAAVNHENVVRVHAVGEQPLPYLVMELITGETLQDLLDRGGRLEAAEAVRISRQIAAGLTAAHSTGLIHRDVKPANVLIERGPARKVKLTDFGLARSTDDTSLSQSPVVAGTPMFMSPEQARGERVDHRTDLFSLGSIMYTMLTGRPPFYADNTLAVLRHVSEEAPPPLSELAPRAPTWLVETVGKLHAKQPDERYQSIEELSVALDRGESVPPGDPMPAKDAPPRRRHRKFVAATVVLLLLGVATGVISSRKALARRFGLTPTPTADLRGIFPSDQVTPTVDADRVAAEWVMSLGEPCMWVLIKGGEGKLIFIRTGDELPQKPFELHRLNLNRHGKVTDEGLAALRGLRHLTWLQITNVPVTDAGLIHLKDCKKLQALQLYATRITDAGLPHLAGLTELRTLSLKQTRVTEEGAKNLAKYLPRCWIEWNRDTIEPTVPD